MWDSFRIKQLEEGKVLKNNYKTIMNFDRFTCSYILSLQLSLSLEDYDRQDDKQYSRPSMLLFGDEIFTKPGDFLIDGEIVKMYWSNITVINNGESPILVQCVYDVDDPNGSTKPFRIHAAKDTDDRSMGMIRPSEMRQYHMGAAERAGKKYVL